MQRNEYEANRELLLRRVRLSLVGSVILISWALFAFLPLLDEGLRAFALELVSFAKKLSVVEGAVDKLHLPPWAEGLVGPLCLAAPFILKSRKLAQTIADRFLPMFRADLFLPIQRPRTEVLDNVFAPTVVMATGSAMARTHAAIVTFARQGTARRRTGWIGPVRPEVPLAWNLLTGPSGHGKTRLAHEVGRQLARRDVLGGDGAPGAWRLRLRAWVHEHCTWLRTDDEIPWDAGRLRAELSLDPGLETWRPRRATLLLIDDPKPDFSGQVLRALAKVQPSYRFPVRVLIVSQVVLRDIGPGLAREHSLVPERSSMLPVLDQSYDLRTDLGFCRAFVSAILGPDRGLPRGLRLDSDLRELVHRTEANPLVFELAVRALNQRSPPMHGPITAQKDPVSLDRNGLLAKLAAPFIERLALQGIDREGRDAIVVASLADGPPWEDWSRAMAGKIPSLRQIVDLFPYAEETPELERYIRDQHTWKKEHPIPAVPRIRPDMLADRIVLELTSAHGRVTAKPELERLVGAAWRASVAGTMRTALRLSAAASKSAWPRSAAIDTGEPDDLLAILRQTPQRAAFHNDRAHLLAAFELAARFGLARSGSTSARDDVKEVAALLSKVSLDLLIEAWPELEDRLAEPDTTFDRAADLGITMLETAGDAASFARRLQLLQTIMGKKAPTPSKRTGDQRYKSMAKILERTITDATTLLGDRDRRKAVEDLVGVCASHGVDAATMIEKVIDRLDEPSANPEVERCRKRLLLRLGAKLGGCLQVADAGGEEPRLVEIANQLGDLAKEIDQDEEVVVSIAEVWSHVAFARSQIKGGAGAAAAEAAVRTVASIALPFPASEKVQRWVAWAWSYVALAFSEIPAGAGAAEVGAVVRIVASIASLFPAREEMQEPVAWAWNYAAGSLSQIPAGAGAAAAAEAAAMAASIAARFSSSQKMRVPAAVAWSHVALAFSEIPAGAGAAEAEAAARTVVSITVPFHASEELHESVVRAWCHVASARSRISAGAGAVEAKEAASAAASIAQRFPGHAKIHEPVAHAWSTVAYALGQIPAGAGAAAAEEAAKTVASIASPFPESAVMRSSVVWAWHFVAFAHCQIPAGVGAAGAEEAARLTGDYATGLPQSDELKLLNALAWCYVAFAHSHIPAGAGATTAQEAARTVQSIATPFAASEKLQVPVARAWSHVAFAYSKLPLGAGAAAAEEAAHMVASIATPFQATLEMQEPVAWALSYVADARSKIPSGAGAEAAEEAARKVASIAALFPPSEEIREATAKAWAFVARAHALRPGGLGRQMALLAVDRILMLVARFPTSTRLREIRAGAVRDLASLHPETLTGQAAASAPLSGRQSA